MSNSKYRFRPGMPRTETDAMLRGAAIEMLDHSLAELESEIRIVQATADLYHSEILARQQAAKRGAETGRWQVAPGVGLRAVAMLRKLREKRDAMLAEAEEEILEQVTAKEPAKEPVKEPAKETAKTAAPETVQETAKPKQPATPTATNSESHHSPTKSRDPAKAA